MQETDTTWHYSWYICYAYWHNVELFCYSAFTWRGGLRILSSAASATYVQRITRFPDSITRTWGTLRFFRHVSFIFCRFRVFLPFFSSLGSHGSVFSCVYDKPLSRWKKVFSCVVVKKMFSCVYDKPLCYSCSFSYSELYDLFFLLVWFVLPRFDCVFELPRQIVYS